STPPARAPWPRSPLHAPPPRRGLRCSRHAGGTRETPRSGQGRSAGRTSCSHFQGRKRPRQVQTFQVRPHGYAGLVAVLTSRIERDPDVFARRRERMEQLVGELRERTAQVARGGGDKALERHRWRGEVTARGGGD